MIPAPPAVRPRRDSDLAACAAVLSAVQAADGYPVQELTDPEAFLSPAGQLAAWVAVTPSPAGAVAGHVALSEPAPSYEPALVWSRQSGEPLDRIGVLGRLFVAPGARGLGLGSRLVAAVVAECATRGLRPLLDVVTKDTAAIALYERLGWIRFGTVTHRFGPGGTTDAYGYVRRSPSDGRMPP